jgi:hypothetical protein
MSREIVASRTRLFWQRARRSKSNGALVRSAGGSVGGNAESPPVKYEIPQVRRRVISVASSSSIVEEENGTPRAAGRKIEPSVNDDVTVPVRLVEQEADNRSG